MGVEVLPSVMVTLISSKVARYASPPPGFELQQQKVSVVASISGAHRQLPFRDGDSSRLPRTFPTSALTVPCYRKSLSPG